MTRTFKPPYKQVHCLSKWPSWALLLFLELFTIRHALNLTIRTGYPIQIPDTSRKHNSRFWVTGNTNHQLAAPPQTEDWNEFALSGVEE